MPGRRKSALNKKKGREISSRKSLLERGKKEEGALGGGGVLVGKKKHLNQKGVNGGSRERAIGEGGDTGPGRR